MKKPYIDKDPFHGSISYEIIDPNDNSNRVGCIIGPDITTLYSRYIIGRKSKRYEEKSTISTDALDIKNFMDFVLEYLNME